MPPRTMTISLPPGLAREVDRLAKAERRSRSEFFREALRQYIGRLERWDRIFAAGESAARSRGVAEGDVDRIVKEERRKRRA